MNMSSIRYRSSGKAVDEEDILILARQIAAQRYQRIGNVLSSPNEVRDFLSHTLGARENEVFLCLLLDSKHRPIAHCELFQGSISTTQVHIREIVKYALKHNSAAVIVCHNHPSGATYPSDNDIALTKQLKKVLDIVEVRLLDHMICGENVQSLAELGHL